MSTARRAFFAEHSLSKELEIGETIYAYVSKYGYVGLGTVIKKSVPFRNAVLASRQPIASVPITGKYNASEHDDTCDWIALVDWQYAVEKSEAVRKTPFTISTACKIYEHRQEDAKQIKAELAERSGKKPKSPIVLDAPF